MTQPTEYQQLTYNSPDGAQAGNSSTVKLAFYGATPIARPVTASTSSVSTITSVSISTLGCAVTSWLFNSGPDMDNAVIAVSTMQYALKQLGLMV